MLQAMFDKSELEEMIESACVYDDIDAKLQKIMVETHSRLLSNNAIDYFSIVIEKYNIRQIKKPQKIEGFCLVKDPRFGWGPNNWKYYMLVPEEIALKCKVLGYFA